MAQPIVMRVSLIPIISTYSVENGAANRNTGVFNFYKLLKLTLIFPYSTEAGALSLSLLSVTK